MNVVILGSGRIGSAMARDLATDWSVTVADRDEAALEAVSAKAAVGTVSADLSDPSTVSRLVADYDMVINAMPGFLGYQTLEAILQAGRNVVDIAFFPEDPFGLDELAMEKGVVAVVDCGVCPGMSGILIGHASTQLDTIEDAVVYVGGLPADREWPWEYKAVFSPIDVIAEYTRPARMIENGQVVIRPALSDVELLDFDGVGTLEAFNTDGLRTLLHTVEASTMVEKTLRYPGHAEQMRVLRESGFFAEDPIEVAGEMVRPIDLTTKLLFPMWKLGEGEADVTVMQTRVTGTKDGRPFEYVYELFDRYDAETDVTSMARTTGYTATTVARLVAAGGYSRTGISPPEFVGREPGALESVLAGLAERGVQYESRSGFIG